MNYIKISDRLCKGVKMKYKYKLDLEIETNEKVEIISNLLLLLAETITGMNVEGDEVKIIKANYKKI